MHESTLVIKCFGIPYKCSAAGHVNVHLPPFSPEAADAEGREVLGDLVLYI